MLPTQAKTVAETKRDRAAAKVEVHHDPQAILADWAALEAVAPASAYQTRTFVLAWINTVGASRGVIPMFVLARDSGGHAIALLCLGIERHGPFRIARFISQRESNFNLGLVWPGTVLNEDDLRFLLREAAKKCGAIAPHVYLLQNQPFDWEGIPNPFAHLPHQPSPSYAYATELAPDGEKFLAAKLSKDTRKKLRKKEARLVGIGPVSLVSNDTRATTTAILDAFFAEKIARCEARAISADFDHPAMRAFFERLSYPTADGASWFEFHGLKVGERIVATYAGGPHRGRFSCLVNSFDADPEIAKSSPGDLLLTHLIRQKCDLGIKSFDLGIGEARYKETYCNITVELFDTVVPMNAIGWLLGIALSLRLRAKMFLKQNPKILTVLQRLRRKMPVLAAL